MKGFDVIVEMLANVNLMKDLELIGFGGRLAVGVTQYSDTLLESDFDYHDHDYDDDYDDHDQNYDVDDLDELI